MLRPIMFAVALLTASVCFAQVQNGSFDDALQHWQLEQGASDAIAIDDAQCYTLPHALRIQHRKAAGTSRASQLFAVEENQAYTLVARMSCEGLQGGGATISISNGSQTIASSEAVTGDTPWQRVAIVFNPNTATRVTVTLAVKDTQGAAYFDDVQLIRGRAAAPAVTGGDYEQLDNIALGKPYTYNRTPGYEYSRDDGDREQLTDGAYTDGYFWTQKSTVGWVRVHPVTVTINLGDVQPIGGLSVNTAGGRAGVELPSHIYVFSSDDNKAWRYNGDLVAISNAEHGPPNRGEYVVHRFHSEQLNMRGQHVQIMIPLTDSFYTFLDEIEIYRGDGALLAGSAPGDVVESPDDFFTSVSVTGFAKRRMRADLGAISEALGTQHADLAERIEAVHIDDGRGFRAVLPLNDVHRDIMRLQALVWRKQGFDGLVVWQANDWDMISHLEPPREGGAMLDVHMMRNERQAASFFLSNATDAPASVKLVAADLPDGCVTVHESPYTDTISGTPVFAALPVAARDGDASLITVDSGMTKQVWLTFDSRGMDAGTYSGTISLASHNKTVPVSLTVYPATMPDKPRLHVGGWDYTDRDAQYDITVENRDAVIAHLSDRHVDTPWATNAVMYPNSRDTTRLNTWISRWPNAANFFVFVSVKPTTFGEMGSDAWREAVTDWINFWAGAFNEQGVDPSQIGLLLVDENHSPEQDETIIAHAEVIHAAQPDIVIFQDPTYKQPSEATPRMLEVSDILCPNTQQWVNNADEFEQVYLSYTGEERELWFYVCDNPGKLLDPYAYHRMQPWFCWKFNGKGVGYWAFGDSNGASTWNEYLMRRGAYTPMFLDATSVTAGKHMEAIREGVEDYETMSMLRDRVNALSAQGIDNETMKRARELLATSGDRVIGVMNHSDTADWIVPKDRSVMDQVRVEALKLLGELSSM